MNTEQSTTITTEAELDALVPPVAVMDASGEFWYRARPNDLWTCGHGDEHSSWLVVLDASQPLKPVFDNGREVDAEALVLALLDRRRRADG